MNFTCPYCGNGSFVVTHDGEGSSLATCGKCAKVIPFEKYMMTNSPDAGTSSETDRLHRSE
jgi:ribosomal protein S27AE